MNLSAPFIRRPIMTTFVMLSIILAGWMAFIKLPVSDLPTIERPEIMIMAGYSGASPEAVLNQVTIPIEKELVHVKGVQEITSTSSSGISSIFLSFDISKNMTEAIRDVQEALNKAEMHLPRDLDPRPTYTLQQGSQDPIMWFILTSDFMSVGEVRSYADSYVIPRLTRIEGVAKVLTFGEEKSVWIRVNPELMAARQIGFNQVIDTIREHTSQAPLGSIQTSSKKLSIEWTGTIQDAKELEDLKIGNTNVRLKDIGEISAKSNHTPEFFFIEGDKTSRALILGIQKINDANTVAISKEVKEAFASIKKELPKAIELTLFFDKAIWINDSLFDMQWTLVFAFVLVVIVIFLSLGRISESLITSMALPLSLVGTFAVMYLANFSLDLLSLLALTLSVGFVVDDAIVVLENIVRKQDDENLDPLEASLQGSKQICFTIFSMTLSLVAVFIPLLFLSGINGRLFREFSITLAVAILVSGFVSLTLTPMLCSRFLSKHTGKSNLQNKIAATNSWMVNLYGKSLNKCFSYPKTILLMAVLCIGATLFLFTKLPVSFIPPEDRGFLFAFVKMPSGLAPDKMLEQQKKLEGLVKANPHIENFLSLNFEGNLLFVVRTLPQAQRPPLPLIIGELQATLDAIPGTQTFIQPYQLINLDLDLQNAGQYEFVIRGMDFKDVEIAAQNLTIELQKHPEFSFVMNTANQDSPVLVMHVNQDTAHLLGLGTKQIQDVLKSAFAHNQVGVIQKGANQEKIFLELMPDYQKHLDAPNKLYIASADGNMIPFKTLATWEEKLGNQILTRREQLPANSLRFSLSEETPPGKGMERIEEIASEALPSNVSGVLVGSAKAISSTMQNTLILLLAAALVMYIVLGILYESFIHPLTILSSIPFAGLGGIITLFLFNEPISIFSAVGFLLLIGIVKKNGIMMVDYAVEARRLGATSEQAIFEACLVRFRPIMMTTIAAIMGAIPIVIGFGEGSEIRRGLGLVIAGGLMFSQILTLYVTPIIYMTFDKMFSKAAVKNDIGKGGNGLLQPLNLLSLK